MHGPLVSSVCMLHSSFICLTTSLHNCFTHFTLAEAIVIVTGIFTRRLISQLVTNFLLFFKNFCCLFLLLAVLKVFLLKSHFKNIKNCSAPTVSTHVRKAEAKWLFSLNGYGNVFRHKRCSEDEFSSNARAKTFYRQIS